MHPPQSTLFRSLWDLSPAQSAGIFPQVSSIDLKLA
jgi:hypothetical protein